MARPGPHTSGVTAGREREREALGYTIGFGRQGVAVPMRFRLRERERERERRNLASATPYLRHWTGPGFECAAKEWDKIFVPPYGKGLLSDVKNLQNLQARGSPSFAPAASPTPPPTHRKTKCGLEGQKRGVVGRRRKRRPLPPPPP